MWLLRTLVIIVLFVQCLWMLTAAGLPLALLFDADAVRPALGALSEIAPGVVLAITGWEIALSLAVLFFFILALVRLIRRTRAFIVWFLGFFCLLALRSMQGIAGDIAGTAPAELATKAWQNLSAPEFLYFNAGLLAFNVLIGIAIVFIDLTDQRHWAAFESEAI